MLSIQGDRGDGQNQKKQRDDDRWHDPLDQAKPRQFTLLFFGGSVRYSQSPMEAMGSAVMADPTLTSGE